MQQRKQRYPKASDSSHDFRNYGMSEGEVAEYVYEKSKTDEPPPEVPAKRSN